MLLLGVLSKTSSRSHITPIPATLQWLPVKFRIYFKIFLFIYWTLHGLAPSDIRDQLTPHMPVRHLRSIQIPLEALEINKFNQGEQ